MAAFKARVKDGNNKTLSGIALFLRFQNAGEAVIIKLAVKSLLCFLFIVGLTVSRGNAYAFYAGELFNR